MAPTSIMPCSDTYITVGDSSISFLYTILIKKLVLLIINLTISTSCSFNQSVIQLVVSLEFCCLRNSNPHSNAGIKTIVLF